MLSYYSTYLGAWRFARWGAPALAGLLLSVPVPAADAAVTPKDMQIIGRALTFLDPPMNGSVEVGIVYDAASKTEAEALASQMGAGFAAGAVTLVPKLMTADAAQSSAVKVLLPMANIGAPLVKAASGRKVLVISTDPGCIDAKSCILSIQSDPKVQITLNRSDADAAGISLAASFRMMIKER